MIISQIRAFTLNEKNEWEGKEGGDGQDRPTI